MILLHNTFICCISRVTEKVITDIDYTCNVIDYCAFGNYDCNCSSLEFYHPLKLIMITDCDYPMPGWHELNC